MRPEWPGDGARRPPEPPRDPWPGDDAGLRRAPRPQRDRWPGDDAGARRAPRSPQDPWSGQHARHAPEPPRDQWRDNEPHGDQWRGNDPQADQWRGNEPQGDRPGVGQTNPVAIASLLCGIALILDLIGRLGSLLVAIPAVICGGIALWQIYNRGGRGQGLAVGGLIVGIIGILAFVVVGG